MVSMMNKTTAALLALALVTLAGTASADPVVVKTANVVSVSKKPGKQMVCQTRALVQGSGTVKTCEWK